MLKQVWRRFRPKRVGSLHDVTLFEADSLYARARLIVDDALHEARARSGCPQNSVQTAARAARNMAEKDARDPSHLLAKLLLMTPGAAKAQEEMDKHRGGYKNRQARLYELIDFNDTFVDTVLSLPSEELVPFADRLRQEMQTFCSKLGCHSLRDEQFDAIVHGLSREIAVYHGARSLGYIVHMTSRAQDAMGIDMIITDPETKKSINIDVKTNSAFHFRLLDLAREKRVDEEKRMYCELAGYCIIRNGKGAMAIDTVLFRVATQYLGPIEHFKFKNTDALATLIREAMKDHGMYVAGVG